MEVAFVQNTRYVLSPWVDLCRWSVGEALSHFRCVCLWLHEDRARYSGRRDNQSLHIPSRGWHIYNSCPWYCLWSERQFGIVNSCACTTEWLYWGTTGEKNSNVVLSIGVWRIHLLNFVKGILQGRDDPFHHLVDANLPAHGCTISCLLILSCCSGSDIIFAVPTKPSWVSFISEKIDPKSWKWLFNVILRAALSRLLYPERCEGLCF